MSLFDMVVTTDFEVKVGDLRRNNYGCLYTVIRIRDSYNATIRYLDKFSHEQTLALRSARLGITRNPYAPTLAGVGYIGSGKYMSSVSRGTYTREYMLWAGLIRKYYDRKKVDITQSKYNKNVCPEWHNFQTFADWVVSLGYYDDQLFSLNTTLLADESNVIGPDTTCFIPDVLVGHLVRTKPRRVSTLPMGIILPTRCARYLVQIKCYGKSQPIAKCVDIFEAISIHKHAKEEHVKEVANLYRHELEPRVYDALMSWKYIL